MAGENLTINVSSLGSQNPNYFGWHFTLPEIDDEGKVTAPAGWWGCREGMIAYAQSCILKKDSAAVIKNFKTNKTRVLWKFFGPEEVKGEVNRWVEVALSWLHAHEKFAGWARTSVHEVKVKGKGSHNYKVSLFIGSRRWMKSPFLLSMYNLIIRAARNQSLKKVSDLSDCDKQMKKLLGEKPTTVQDYGFLKQTYKYWKPLMKNYPDLFEKRKITYYWDDSRYNNYPGGFGRLGISVLCNGETSFGQEFMKLASKK